MRRTILHCDLNCFFASVEMLYHPEFRNVAMAVAGDPKDRHGIILAKNVPAKKAGVRTAESIREALKKCPELIIRTPDYESYMYFSDRIRQLYYEYTDRVEPFGIDECWLDITHSISYFGSVEAIVSSLLERARTEIGLTLSIGISFNKVYAKLGSDLAKEDSYCYIDSLEDVRFLPASSLLGVGTRCTETLKSYGIETIGDAAEKSEAYLHSILGKAGITLHSYACGIDDSEVSRFDRQKDESAKSISHTMTSTRDIRNLDDLKVMLKVLSEHVAKRLREKGLYYRTVHLFVRNNKLKVRTMQTKLRENSDLGKEIYRQALLLFNKNCDFSVPFRSIGVAVSDLSHEKDGFQTDLFNESGCYSQRQRNEELAIEKIRSRFGNGSIASLRVFSDSALSKIAPDDGERKLT